MSDAGLSFLDLVRIQLRLHRRLGWRRRLIGFGLVLVQLVSIVLFGVILGVTINDEGVSFSQILELAEIFEVPLSRAGGGLLLAFATLVLVAWFGPFRLWDGESPKRRQYHWSMPVSKPRHDLARVAAGLVLLAGWEVALYGSVVLLAAASGQPALAGWPAATVPCLLLGPLLLYLLTSVFAVRLEHPGGWTWALVGVVAALQTFGALLGIEPLRRLMEVALLGGLGLGSAVAGPVFAAFLGAGRAATGGAWAAAWGLWLVVLVLALVWAARDRRRMP